MIKKYDATPGTRIQFKSNLVSIIPLGKQSVAEIHGFPTSCSMIGDDTKVIKPRNIAIVKTGPKRYNGIQMVELEVMDECQCFVGFFFWCDVYHNAVKI
jgi:hypothetical protein